MGNTQSRKSSNGSLSRGIKPAEKIFGSRDVRILLLGLDNSGKTTILYRLKLKANADKEPKPLPTIGFNSETIKCRNLNLQLWDCGGQDSIRSLWRHYFSGCNGLVWVVDSADKDRIQEAAKELQKVLDTLEMEHVPVAVIANKQDLPQALDPPTITTMLSLKDIRQPWDIFPVSASDGKGLSQVIEWLSKHV